MPAASACIHTLRRASKFTMPAAEPGEYPCPANHDEHSTNTDGANGPTGTRGIRSTCGRAVNDLFVTAFTSRHYVSEA